MSIPLDSVLKHPLNPSYGPGAKNQRGLIGNLQTSERVKRCDALGCNNIDHGHHKQDAYYFSFIPYGPSSNSENDGKFLG